MTDGVLQYTFSNVPNSRGIIPMQTSPENDKPLVLLKLIYSIASLKGNANAFYEHITACSY